MLDRAARLARLGTRLVSALAGLLMLALRSESIQPAEHKLPAG